MSRQRALVVLALGAFLALLTQSMRGAAQPPPVQTVRGIIVDVRSSSIVHAEAIVLQSDDGQVLPFRVDPEVATNRDEPQTASHMRQHMILAEPMLVHFRETADGLVAVRVIDADVATD